MAVCMPGLLVAVVLVVAIAVGFVIADIHRVD